MEGPAFGIAQFERSFHLTRQRRRVSPGIVNSGIMVKLRHGIVIAGNADAALPHRFQDDIRARFRATGEDECAAMAITPGHLLTRETARPAQVWTNPEFVGQTVESPFIIAAIPARNPGDHERRNTDLFIRQDRVRPYQVLDAPVR